MGTRKHWSNEELDVIFKEIETKTYREHPDWVMFRLVKTAQSVLPTHRRRNLVNSTMVPPRLRKQLVEALPKWRINGIHQVTEAVAKLPEPVAPVRSEQEIIDEYVAKMMERVEGFAVRCLVKAATEMMQHPLIEALIQGQVEKAAGIFAAQQSRPKGPHNPEMRSEDRVYRPKVMILGLKPHQRAVFESRYSEFSFRFWWDDDYKLLDAKIQGSDVVLATMEAVSHDAVAHVTRAGKRLIRVTGAQSSLIAAVDELRREFKEHGQLHT